MIPRTRLLGIDPGKVRLGLAVSDPDRRIASPLATYTRRDLEQDARYLRGVIETEEIGQLVIGLPVHLSGREGEQAQLARAFGAWLGRLTALPCVFWDERFSSLGSRDIAVGRRTYQEKAQGAARPRGGSGAASSVYRCRVPGRGRSRSAR